MSGQCVAQQVTILFSFCATHSNTIARHDQYNSSWTSLSLKTLFLSHFLLFINHPSHKLIPTDYDTCELLRLDSTQWLSMLLSQRFVGWTFRCKVFVSVLWKLIALSAKTFTGQTSWLHLSQNIWQLEKPTKSAHFTEPTFTTRTTQTMHYRAKSLRDCHLDFTKGSAEFCPIECSFFTRDIQKISHHPKQV